LSKEGYGIFAAMFVGILIFVLGWKLTGNNVLIAMAVILLLFELFCIYFFRDPQREITHKENVIVSPGDGKIVEIVEVYEDDYLQSDALKIAVFLSVFNVHISRVPLSGKVEYMQYRRGKFLAAYSDKASKLNEQTIIGVNTKYGKILFKQIAGAIARRIVCYLREGNVVKTGEKFGIIKFGSRMEVFLPKSVTIAAKLGDKVKAGVTVIGKFDE